VHDAGVREEGSGELAVLIDAGEFRETCGGLAGLIEEDEGIIFDAPSGFVGVLVAVDVSAGIEADGRGAVGANEIPNGIGEIGVELGEDVGDGLVGEEGSFEVGAITGCVDGLKRVVGAPAAL